MSTSLSPDEGRLRSYFEAFTSPEVGGTTSGGVSRPAASDMDAEARRRLVEIMDGLGLRTRIDDIGNMYGRYANADNEGAAPVVIGSHLDTVVPGGRYDGILGVVLALETIALLQERDVHGSRPVELVNFTGEEGARFAPAMLGSGVATGLYDVDYAVARTDAEGAVLGEELERIGYAGDRHNRLGEFSVSLEAHIEQDTNLDDNHLSVGIVDGIRPVTWSTITLTGPGGHAGGRAQVDRQDPLVAAARMAASVDEDVRAMDGAKATIGQMNLHPGSANVIPSRVTFNLDLRASQESSLRDLLNDTSEKFAVIAEEFGVTYSIDTYWRMPEAVFDEDIRTVIARSAETLGIQTMTLTGDIGHDSLHLSQVGRSAMLFVRTSGGISHAEDEHVPWPALLDAARLYANTVVELIK
ncbi:Zn-dependent hydrolase [Brevibacterium metallidurans]